MNSRCFVYVIGAEGLPVVKIGKAVNPEDRMRALQTGTPVQLSLLWTTPGGLDLEKHLHRHFRAHRKHGEWFDLTQLGDPVTVVQQAIHDGATDSAAPPTGSHCCHDWECNGRFGETCIHTGQDMSHRRPTPIPVPGLWQTA